MTFRKTSLIPLALVGALIVSALPVGAAPIDTGKGFVVSTNCPDPINCTSQIRTDTSTTECGQIIGGRGASFQYQLWHDALPFYNAEGCNKAAYWSCGSGCGKAGILGTAASPVTVDTTRVNDLFAGDASAGTTAGARWTLFGGSDAPLSSSEYGRMNLNGAPDDEDTLVFPITLGGVTMAYNIASCADGELILTGALIGRMYRPLDANGISMWNHPDLVALNPCLASEATPIVRVIRSDSSGTTFAFSDFLARTAGSPWVATQSITGIAQNYVACPQNAGVSTCVGSSYGALGYIELAQAMADSRKVSRVVNAAGNPIYPDADGFQAAADGAHPTLPAANGNWSAVSIANAPGALSYPISSFSYVVVYANPYVVHRSASDNANYRDQWNANQYAATIHLLKWMLTTGQEHFPAGYAALTPEVAEIGLAGLARAAYGEEATFTLGATPGKTTLEQGAPCAGSRIAMSSGLFVDTDAYCTTANGNVVIVGGVVVSDGAVIGKVSPGASIEDGVYSFVGGHTTTGVFYASVAN